MHELLEDLDPEQGKNIIPSPPPDWMEPMLATLTERRFSDPGWIFERKFDGERCLVFRKGGRVRLLSRNRHRLNEAYPRSKRPSGARSRFVADGEIGLAAMRPVFRLSPGCRSPTPRGPAGSPSRFPLPL
jgi:ATP-dependent DNA ligase